MYNLLGLLNDNFGTLLCYKAKMLIWAPSSQSMCTFYFCINPWLLMLIEFKQVNQLKIPTSDDFNFQLNSNFLMIELN